MATSSSSSGNQPKKYSQDGVDKQRAQLEKLLKDPQKPAYIPPPPKEKLLRPAREMMKNVQGSSAGAGSGEFHVYKASRRREYERLKLLDDEAKKEIETAEFEKQRREREEAAEAKTAKNRAKRQKRKDRAKSNKEATTDGVESSRNTDSGNNDAPIKKRRLVNGRELLFKRPDDDNHSESDEEPSRAPAEEYHDAGAASSAPPATIDDNRITIIEDE